MVNYLYLYHVSKRLPVRMHLKMDTGNEYHLPLLRVPNSLKKITYNRKNLSDVVEAILGSLFLRGRTLHEVHDFLEQKVDFYGTE